ncbi:MAG: oxidoreductase [Planctomycetaceae bacterium]|nr:oxidoreductase [Planctomycetaceae bacterium]
MTELDSPGEPNAAPATPRQRRAWFPLVWPIALFSIWLAAKLTVDDRGLHNSLLHVAIILTAVGWTLWLLGFSTAPARRRWTLCLLIMGPLCLHYFQLSPLELVTDGDVGIVGVRWRWQEPDRDLAPPKTSDSQVTGWQPTADDYPAFLGGKYWARVDDPGMSTDWQADPPQQLWKRRIGAGWSAFAVVGPYAVTQEQRGDEELVTCYEVATGEPLWTHANTVRFDPSGGGSLGGVGPRATPAIHEGRVYAHGATGIVDCLDATSGQLLWSVNTVEELGASPLLWGKSTSPVVLGDKLLVSIGQTAGAQTDDSQRGSLVAFDLQSGEIRWASGERRCSYATPVVATFAGVEQIVVVNEDFITSHAPDTGQILWEHPWPGNSDANASNSQPIPVGDDQLFVSKGYGEGAELIGLSADDDHWSIERVWKRPVMKTKFSNVVVHDGFVYGLDAANLQCIELATGKQAWKKRRRPAFGHGQVLQVGEHLLILSESGEVILVALDPDAYRELSAFPAIDGVTWNNPTLTGDKLLVRNAEWAACYQLPTAGGSAEPSDAVAAVSR